MTKIKELFKKKYKGMIYRNNYKIFKNNLLTYKPNSKPKMMLNRKT